jgi:dUTPase
METAQSSRYAAKPITKKVVIKRLQSTAEYPYIDIDGSAAFNVTLIARTESRSEDNQFDVGTFHTGLSIFSLPENTYLEIIPHPALYKNGYTLVGPLVFDKSYVGEIIIPLYKFKDVDCLELPFPAVQMLVRQQVLVHIAASPEEIKTKDDFATPSYMMPTVMYQAEGSSRGEPSYKGGSRGKSSNASGKKGNHMY